VTVNVNVSVNVRVQADRWICAMDSDHASWELSWRMTTRSTGDVRGDDVVVVDACRRSRSDGGSMECVRTMMGR
jgi:hypothetical protein